MKKLKKTLAVLLAATMVLGLLAACDDGSADVSDTPDSSATPAPSTDEYPITPEELGSGEVKWSEEETDDGWMMVTNDGGETLGYSSDSGVTLIQVDGFAFKDLNRNGQLDLYEDWRQEAADRATDLASQLPADMIAGLMVHESIGSYQDDGADASTFGGALFSESMQEGVRTTLNFATSYPITTQVAWNNNAQELAESLDYGIPVTISTNPLSIGWAGNLALGATFDPEYVKEVSEMQADQYRALGMTTLLGPQIDLTTEPRWSRIDGAWGEDPALSRDLTNAAISGFQSTYDESGNDLGWGADSVIAMMKHFPGDGPGESGREAHSDSGKYNVYPGDAFETSLIPFIDGGLNLDSATGEAAGVMTSYSIAYSEDGSLGDLVGSAFSEYKISILRDTYGYDSLICTDWSVTADLDGSPGGTPWGVEDIPVAERIYMAISAGVDQIGGQHDNPQGHIRDAYAIAVEEMGEEEALARFRESARRILTNTFLVGLFENPYILISDAQELINGEAYTAAALESQQKSVVMLKNDGNVIKAAESSEEKPTVYIPMKFEDGQWILPVNRSSADHYYNVVTDTVWNPSGEADADGNPTYTENDIIRASAAELAECDYALVIVSNPQNATQGYDEATGKYVPISLQYGEYTANSEAVRAESISGNIVETEVMGTYGVVTMNEKENRSYYGESATITNTSDLEGILYTAENMPEDAPVIVAVNTTNPLIFSEFEDQVDAILVGFGIDNDVFMDIVTGQVEPSGLLPLQMPANMETVEAQYEDVPRDMECYVDSAGNTYDFGFGLNWSGVIQDERTETYCVEPLTEPATQPVS